MSNPAILVTAATGKTGSATIDELLKKDLKVRALVCRRDARSASLEARGADVIEADLLHLKDMLGATQGI